MADYTAARAAIEDFGENMEHIGFEAPFRTIFGNNQIGDSVRYCDSQKKFKIVRNYLKSVAKDIDALPDTNPQKATAIECLRVAWKEFLEALDDGLSEQDQRVGQGQIAKRAS